MRAGNLRVIAPAAALPVSVDDARRHCAVDHADDDAQIEGFIRAALDWVQPPIGFLGRSIMRQTLRLDLPCWPYEPLQLPAGPIDAVMSVKYFDPDNAEQTLDEANYFLDEDTLLWTAAFSEPALYLRPGAVRITYTAGYESADAIPAPIVLALKMCVAHWYENREIVASQGELNMIPLGAQDLLAPYRLWA
ncbi:MAG: head-tail connector protein [Hyphomonadaceae bacterium]